MVTKCTTYSLTRSLGGLCCLQFLSLPFICSARKSLCCVSDYSFLCRSFSSSESFYMDFIKMDLESVFNSDFNKMSTVSDEITREHMWKNIPLFMLLGIMIYGVPLSPFTLCLCILIMFFNIRLCIE